MSKILVYAYRDWSFENLEPSLYGLNYDRWWFEKGPICIDDYSLIITCEPHIDGWLKAYKIFKRKVPVLALQQSLFWVDVKLPNSSWKFDQFLVWGEMQRDMCVLHDLSDNKIIITGNPKFDKYFDMETEDHGYTLILASREDGKDDFPGFDNVIFRPHPARNNYEPVKESFDNQVKNVKNVVFAGSGSGIVPLILKKPCMILPVEANDRRRKNGYLRYWISKLYCTGKWGTDDEYVRYAVGDFGATERVRREILRFV